jgi:hypothetical protein
MGKVVTFASLKYQPTATGINTTSVTGSER